MGNLKIEVGDTVCYKWDCLASIIEVTGRVTDVRKSNVEVYNESPSSRGCRSVPYESIVSINGKTVIKE